MQVEQVGDGDVDDQGDEEEDEADDAEDGEDVEQAGLLVVEVRVLAPFLQLVPTQQDEGGYLQGDPGSLTPRPTLLTWVSRVSMWSTQ